MERIKIEITEAEARVILMAISQILDANARDLDELKLAGFSVREVRAMERVENKIARAKQKGPGEWLAPGPSHPLTFLAGPNESAARI